MPKEQINTPSRRLVIQMRDKDGKLDGYAFGWAQDGDALHDGEHWEETPVLYIGWSHNIETVMQASIEVGAEEVLRAAEEIKRTRKLADEGAGIPGHQSWIFDTTALNRAEAQKLIRVTRRARDQVFEGDE